MAVRGIGREMSHTSRLTIVQMMTLPPLGAFRRGRSTIAEYGLRSCGVMALSSVSLTGWCAFRESRPSECDAKLRSRSTTGSADQTPPDLLVDISVTVVRIIDIIRSAIGADVRLGHKVGWVDIAAPFHASQSKVRFVDQLPSVEAERLRDCRELVIVSANSKAAFGPSPPEMLTRGPLPGLPEARKVGAMKSKNPSLIARLCIYFFPNRWCNDWAICGIRVETLASGVSVVGPSQDALLAAALATIPLAAATWAKVALRRRLSHLMISQAVENARLIVVGLG